MIKKELIPNDVILALVEGIEAEAIKAVQEGEEECFFEVEKGNWYFSGSATLFTREIDDSFSHEFGTESCGHLEYRGIDEVEMETAVYVQDEEEIEVEMDYNRLYDIDSNRNVDRIYDIKIKNELTKCINSINKAV